MRTAKNQSVFSVIPIVLVAVKFKQRMTLVKGIDENVSSVLILNTIILFILFFKCLATRKTCA